MPACAAGCRAASCRRLRGRARRGGRRSCCSSSAAATRRGEIAALVDTFDRLDVASACAAGVDLDRLLWIRGQAIARAQDQGSGSDAVARAHARSRAQGAQPRAAGGRVRRRRDRSGRRAAAGAEAPAVHHVAARAADDRRQRHRVRAASRPSRWRAAPAASRCRSAAAAQWAGDSDRSRRLAGLDVTARVVSPRRRVRGRSATVAATATDHEPQRHGGTEPRFRR